MPFKAEGSSDKYELGGYDGSHFDKYNIDAVITPEEIEEVFQKLSDSPKFIPRTSYQNYPDDLCLFFLILFIVTLFLFAFGGLTMAINSSEMIYFPVFIILFLAFACGGLTLIGTSSDHGCLEARKKNFDEILRDLNNNEFSGRDFHFECGEYGAWIELHLRLSYDVLGQHHKDIKRAVESEMVDELADELYRAGIPPPGKKNWSGF